MAWNQHHVGGGDCGHDRVVIAACGIEDHQIGTYVAQLGQAVFDVDGDTGLGYRAGWKFRLLADSGPAADGSLRIKVEYRDFESVLCGCAGEIDSGCGLAHPAFVGCECYDFHGATLSLLSNQTVT